MTREYYRFSINWIPPSPPPQPPLPLSPPLPSVVSIQDSSGLSVSVVIGLAVGVPLGMLVLSVGIVGLLYRAMGHGCSKQHGWVREARGVRRFIHGMNSGCCAWAPYVAVWVPI